MTSSHTPPEVVCNFRQRMYEWTRTVKWTSGIGHCSVSQRYHWLTGSVRLLILKPTSSVCKCYVFPGPSRGNRQLRWVVLLGQCVFVPPFFPSYLSQLTSSVILPRSDVHVVLKFSCLVGLLPLTVPTRTFLAFLSFEDFPGLTIRVLELEVGFYFPSGFSKTSH